jgi:hypothetical protein
MNSKQDETERSYISKSSSMNEKRRTLLLSLRSTHTLRPFNVQQKTSWSGMRTRGRRLRIENLKTLERKILRSILLILNILWMFKPLMKRDSTTMKGSTISHFQMTARVRSWSRFFRMKK